MKKIPHLEDLAITEDSASLQRLMDNILSTLAGQGPGILTVKADGCPAIFFGRDYDNHKVWVSTKSFLNQTPIRYFTEAEIEAASRPKELEDKLIWLLRLLSHDGSIKPGEIFGGDLIASPWSRITHGFRYRPNIIEYLFYESVAEPGFVFHSYKAPDKLEFSRIIPETNSQWFDSIHFDVEPINHAFVTPDFSKHPFYDLVSTAEADRIKKSINKCIRHGPDGYWKYSHGMSKNRHRAFEELTVLKSYIIDLLQENQQEATYINNQRAFHEGYVYSDDEWTVKLVDRLFFSRANFSDETERGWK